MTRKLSMPHDACYVSAMFFLGMPLAVIKVTCLQVSLRVTESLNKISPLR